MNQEGTASGADITALTEIPSRSPRKCCEEWSCWAFFLAPFGFLREQLSRFLPRHHLYFQTSFTSPPHHCVTMIEEGAIIITCLTLVWRLGSSVRRREQWFLVFS